MKTVSWMLLVAATFFVPPQSGWAQEAKPGFEVRASVAASVFKYDGLVNEKGLYHPAITGLLRVHFFRFFFAEAALTHSWTRRFEEWVCVDTCPAFNRVNGKLLVWTGGGGIQYPWDEWEASVGAAYGWTEDKQPKGLLDYDGPTWSGFVAVERRVSSSLRLIVDLRVHRMHWHNQFKVIGKDVHLTNHQVDLGLSYTLW